MSLGNVLLPPCVEQKKKLIAHISQLFQPNQATIPKINKKENFREGMCECMNTNMTL